MIFSSDMRSKVKEENPDASFGEIAKLIAAKYKAMSQEDRAMYDGKAKKDKQRYSDESKSLLRTF